MPRRKQPKLLTQLCLKSMGEMMKKLVVVVSHDMRNVDDVINCIGEIMISLPQSVGEVVSQEFLNVILETFCPTAPVYIMTNKKSGLLDALVTASLHPRMRYLDVCRNSSFLGRAVWMNLPNLRYLEHLAIGLAISYDVPNPVKFSNHLMELTCHYECTAEMIEELAQTCHGLRKLDVKNSPCVRDKSVATLLHMMNLRILQVKKTGLTAEGCVQLLYKVPNLCKFDSDFCLFKLQNLAKLQPDVGRLFPQLREVAVFWRAESLAPLQEMQNLTKLSVMSSNYEHTGLPAVLEVHGKNLHTLELDFMDDACAASIMHGCPNLKQLSLKLCKFTEMAHNYHWNPSLPHFSSVEELTLDGKFSFFSFPFLYYSNLRYIMCSGVYNLVDFNLTLALSRGWLQYAHTVRFQHCGALSLSAMDALISYCDHLAIVGDLRHWGGVSESDRELVIEHYRKQNVDVTVLIGDHQ